MSIYIKGMKLPTDEPRRLVIYPDGRIYDAAGFFQIDATAEQLHPHGRLGDLDALERNLREMADYQHGDRQQGILGCCNTICSAHTIIPADSG